MLQPSWKLRYLNDKDAIIYPLVEKVQYHHVHKTRCSRIEESYLRRFRSSSFLNTYTPIEAIYGFFAASSFDNPKTLVSTSYITIKQKISLSSREWWVLTRLNMNGCIHAVPCPKWHTISKCDMKKAQKMHILVKSPGRSRGWDEWKLPSPSNLLLLVFHWMK